MKTPVRLSLLLASISLIGAVLEAQPAGAQGSVNKRALEKTTFYSAPRELQIIDENPILKDFRTAPQAAGSIAIPPGPGAGPAAGPPTVGGGPGAGALGNGGGAGGDIPPGGLKLPGNGPGYRTSAPMMPALGSLPQSGFGGSNIPSRGMGPKGLLPPGVTTGVHANMIPKANPAAMSGTPMAGLPTGLPKGIGTNPGKTAGNSAPAVASYSGGYGSGSGNAFGGSSSRADSQVRGFLLKRGK